MFRCAKLLILPSLCIAATASPIFSAEAESVASNSVSLIEAIQTALLRNRELQIERINPEVARSTLSGSYGYYDPVFTAQGRHENTSDNGGFDPADFSRDAIYRAESYIAEAGTTGSLPGGMSYNLGGNYANSFGERNGLNFDSHKVTASASVRQPLLKNFWIDQGRMIIRINKRNLQITELGVAYLTMDIINRVQQAYYELLYARENLAIHEKLLDLRSQALAATRLRIEQGVLTAPDEQLALAQLASVETTLIASSNGVILAENNLKALLGDDFGDVSQRIKPRDPLIAIFNQLHYGKSREHGIAHRPDLSQFREDVEKAKIDLKFRRNQLFPSLDLVAGYGRKGSDTAQTVPPFRADASASRAFDDLRDGTAPSDLLGVVFSIPIGGTSDRANYRASKQAREQAVLRVKQKEEVVAREIFDAFSTATTSFQRVTASTRAAELARSALLAEERKLAGGKSTLFFVLQLQDVLAAAQVGEARAKADYNKAISQLGFTDATLLRSHGLIFEIR